MGWYHWYHFGISLLACLVTVAAAMTHLSAWFRSSLAIVLYNSTRVHAWAIHTKIFVPPIWIKWMWLSLYIYQLLFCIYSLSTLCRPYNIRKSSQHVVHIWSLITYVLGLVALTGWTILKDRLIGDKRGLCTLALFGSCLLLHVSFSIALSSMTSKKSELISKSRLEVFLIRVLMFNAIAAMMSWTIIVSLFEIVQALSAHTSLGTWAIQYMWLAFVSGYIFIFFVIDVTCTVSALEYTFTPFIVAILANGSVLYHNYFIEHPDEQFDDVMVFVAGSLTGFMGLLWFITIGVAVQKGRKFDQPQLKSSEPSTLKSVNLSIDVIRNNVTYEGEGKKWFDPQDKFAYASPGRKESLLK